MEENTERKMLAATGFKTELQLSLKPSVPYLQYYYLNNKKISVKKGGKSIKTFLKQYEKSNS